MVERPSVAFQREAGGFVDVSMGTGPVRARIKMKSSHIDKQDQSTDKTSDSQSCFTTHPAAKSHPDHIIMPIFSPLRMMNVSRSHGDGKQVVSGLQWII